MASRFVRTSLLTLAVLGFAVPAMATVYCHNANDGTVYVYNSSTGQGRWIPVNQLGTVDCDKTPGF